MSMTRVSASSYFMTWVKKKTWETPESFLEDTTGDTMLIQ